MKGPGGAGVGEIDPPVVVNEAGRPAVRVDEVREDRGEGDGERDARIRQLEDRVRELEGALELADAALAAADRHQEIERAVMEAGALDVETVVLLAEIAVGAMDEPNVRSAVEVLKREKPFLFRGGARRRSFGASAMSASVERGAGSGVALGELADEARASGDRGALLTYLRQRRGV